MTKHDVIKICNNSQFTSIATNESWPGKGTVNDPYIIEDMEIDGKYNGSCINISNIKDIHFLPVCY